MAEADEQRFTIIGITFAGDGDKFQLELFDSKAIETMRNERKSRRARWDSVEHILDPDAIFPFTTQGQRVFVPITNREFQRLAPYVGMIVRLNVTAVGA